MAGDVLDRFQTAAGATRKGIAARAAGDQRGETLARARVAAAANSKPSAATRVRLADVQPEVVEWLWASRIPLGKLTVIDGDPGLGKSMLTIELAAKLSRGVALPEHGDLPAVEGTTLLLSAEDGLADTIRPRLEAAGADLTRIEALTAVKGVPPDLSNIAAIRSEALTIGAKLIVIDPIMAFLTSHTDSYKDSDVRRALRPLADLAQEIQAAVVIVRHLSKRTGGVAVHAGGGSVGIGGAARSVLIVAKDPDDESARIIASAKSNLEHEPASLRFCVSKAAPDAIAASIEWLGDSHMNANQLLAHRDSTAGDDAGALECAMEFLRTVLADGPSDARDVIKEARGAGIAERTLDRAKARLGVKAEKSALSKKWRWSLGKGRHARNLAPFEKTPSERGDK